AAEGNRDDDVERHGVDDGDRVGLGIRDEERRRGGGRGGARQGGQQQRGDRSRHARPSHFAFWIAVITTFGGTPRKVNRTASPTRIESVILGEAARKPMVIAGMSPGLPRRLGTVTSVRVGTGGTTPP